MHQLNIAMSSSPPSHTWNPNLNFSHYDHPPRQPLPFTIKAPWVALHHAGNRAPFTHPTLRTPPRKRREQPPSQHHHQHLHHTCTSRFRAVAATAPPRHHERDLHRSPSPHKHATHLHHFTNAHCNSVSFARPSSPLQQRTSILRNASHIHDQHLRITNLANLRLREPSRICFSHLPNQNHHTDLQQRAIITTAAVSENEQWQPPRSPEQHQNLAPSRLCRQLRNQGRKEEGGANPNFGESLCVTCQAAIGQSNWSTGQHWSNGQSQQSRSKLQKWLNKRGRIGYWTVIKLLIN